MSVERKVIANYLGGGWAALMAIAFLPLYIRYLGIESYGLIGLFTTLQAWILLFDVGLSPTLNREMARFSAHLHTPQSIRDLLRSMEIIYAAMAILLSLLVIGCAHWIASDWLKAQTLSVEEMSHALALMGLIISFQWMGTLYRSALLGLQHQVWLSLLTAGMATLRAVGTLVVLALISPTVSVFFAFQCCISVLETGALTWFLHRQLPRPPKAPKFSIVALKSVWRFAAGLTAVTILATLLTQVDKLLLSKLLPLDQFGYFSLAVTVAGALSVMISPVHNVAFPRLTELIAAGNEEGFAREYHRFAQFLSITVLPAALILSVFSKEIILLWTQDVATTDSVAPIVSVWIAGTALNGLMHIPYAAQLAHGWIKLTITMNIAAVLLMVPAVLFWVPKFGGIAAAWIWVAINSGCAFFVITAMHTRILRLEKRPWFFQDVLQPFAAGALVTLALSIVHGDSPMTRVSEVGFLLGGALVVTLTVAIATPLGMKYLRASRPLIHKPKK